MLSSIQWELSNIIVFIQYYCLSSEYYPVLFSLSSIIGYPVSIIQYYCLSSIYNLRTFEGKIFLA